MSFRIHKSKLPSNIGVTSDYVDLNDIVILPSQNGVLGTSAGYYTPEFCLQNSVHDKAWYKDYIRQYEVNKSGQIGYPILVKTAPGLVSNYQQYKAVSCFQKHLYNDSNCTTSGIDHIRIERSDSKLHITPWVRGEAGEGSFTDIDDHYLTDFSKRFENLIGAANGELRTIDCQNLYVEVCGAGGGTSYITQSTQYGGGGGASVGLILPFLTNPSLKTVHIFLGSSKNGSDGASSYVEIIKSDDSSCAFELKGGIAGVYTKQAGAGGQTYFKSYSSSIFTQVPATNYDTINQELDGVAYLLSSKSGGSGGSSVLTGTGGSTEALCSNIGEHHWAIYSSQNPSEFGITNTAPTSYQYMQHGGEPLIDGYGTIRGVGGGACALSPGLDAATFTTPLLERGFAGAGATSMYIDSGSQSFPGMPGGVRIIYNI